MLPEKLKLSQFGQPDAHTLENEEYSWARHLLCQDAPHQRHRLLEVIGLKNDLWATGYRVFLGSPHRNHLATPCI